MNRFAGIKIKNHPGLMGFRGVNLGIMMSGQTLWWERKLNYQRESGSQNYATVSLAMATSQNCVYPMVPIGCDYHEMGFSTLEEEEFHMEPVHFGLGQLAEMVPYMYYK